jgi:hypothetical protein
MLTRTIPLFVKKQDSFHACPDRSVGDFCFRPVPIAIGSYRDRSCLRDRKLKEIDLEGVLCTRFGMYMSISIIHIKELWAIKLPKTIAMNFITI